VEADWLAEPIGFAAGVFVALLTLVVPLASVMMDRSPHTGEANRSVPVSLPIRPDGSQSPARVAGPR
jgi:hypothetical protein